MRIISKPDNTLPACQAFEREIENREQKIENRNKAQFFVVSLSLFTETVLRLLSCCITGLHYMSVYLAKAQQGLKVLISLYMYLCFCLPPFFWGGGGGLKWTTNVILKSSFKPLYLLIRLNIDAKYHL